MGLRNVFAVIFDGNVRVVLILTQINNIVYSTDLLINSICLTIQFHYFYNDMYEKYCGKLHNLCKNMVINHVFKNSQQQSTNINSTVV